MAERRSPSQPVTANADKPAAWRRWLSIALRAAHLAGVIGLGAVLLGAPLPLLQAGAAVLCSGVALLALEIADARLRWNELAGLVSLAKLAAIAWMALDPALAAGLFWGVLFVSAVSSHAPRHWRHWRPGRALPAGPADQAK
ncbi:MAG: hypothetical protein ACHP83_22240 [Burkholderiales bacterium]